MSVDLRHFRSFVVVAEEGNIGRAATRLFITQPALSRQLQQLEQHLGVALFTRVPRGVELTDAGRGLLEKAQIALAAAEDALTIGRPAEPAGRLVVDWRSRDTATAGTRWPRRSPSATPRSRSRCTRRSASCCSARSPTARSTSRSRWSPAAARACATR